MWNQTVDRALVSGVPEGQILEVKQSEIGHKARASIQKSGRNPTLLKSLIMTAIYALELFIGKVFKMASQKADNVREVVVRTEPEQIAVKLEKQNVAIYEREATCQRGEGACLSKGYLQGETAYGVVGAGRVSKAEYTDYQSAVAKWEQQTKPPL